MYNPKQTSEPIVGDPVGVSIDLIEAHPGNRERQLGLTGTTINETTIKFIELTDKSFESKRVI